MANRIEINENVESAIGLNITGASVTVKFRGGAQAPVYDREDGGTLLTQPLSTVNGKIGGDNPSGAWVTGGIKYDLAVAFGSDSLTFPWTAPNPMQLVTTLPAGVGTSAPEDGELAIELYDATNGAAWLRRFRGASSAWDMIGGPPPAGSSLPGTPRARQEFYLTGGSPVIQHQRYNGASWDYVGTPPTVPVTGSPLPVLETGQSGHNRAGHVLSLADFSTVLGLPTTPILLANLTTLTSNLGSGGALVNKGTVVNGNGIDGAATAAQFTGSTAQALYVLDTGAADPFRIKTGTFGCWVKTAKRGVNQYIMAKTDSALVSRGYGIVINSSNQAEAVVSTNGAAWQGDISGISDVADDRWHLIIATFDGSYLRVYVDGVAEAEVATTLSVIFASSGPFNIGGFGADAGTAATNPHFGRVDEAIVLADVLSDDQIRALYSAKFVHGYSTTPTRAVLSVRRKRRGAALVSGDFPSQPVRLHSLVAGALTDAGSGAVALTANNAPVAVVGPDGTKDDAYNLVATSSQSLSSTDAGLPTSAAGTRSYGGWVKTISAATAVIMAWGTANGVSDARLFSTLGQLSTDSGGTGSITNGGFFADGLWHFCVVVSDNGAVDGLKTKLYMDGRLVGSVTTMGAVTLGGANKFRIGSDVAGANLFTGQVSRMFVHSVALTHEQIEVLYQKTSQALATSPKEVGGHVELMDATNVYAVLDGIETQNTIDLAVSA